MGRARFLFIFFAIGAMILAGSSHLFAATRTWVPGEGTDNSPTCSRAYPCATFANALTLTEPGGVISVVDRGDFGPVTISIP